MVLYNCTRFRDQRRSTVVIINIHEVCAKIGAKLLEKICGQAEYWRIIKHELHTTT